MGIFRQAATRKLTSPEQLDTLACVIPPAGWLALLAVTLLFVIAGIWGFEGRIPTKASGTGMITRSAGICEVTPAAAGQLTRLLVSTGSAVEQGQVLAEVELPALLGQIRQSRLDLEQLQSRRRETGHANQEGLRQREDNRALNRKALELSRGDNQQRLTWAEQNVRAQEELNRQGLVAPTLVFEARMQLQGVQHAFDSIAQQLKQLEVEAAEDRRRHQNDLFEIDNQVAARRLQIDTQERELQRQSHVTSPCSGRVIEVTASAGDVVSSQQPILQVEPHANAANDLAAVLFVSSEHGKKVRAGMSVLVNPATVRATEFGGIRGVVVGTSDHPVSARYVSRLLANPDLGQSLAASGSQFQVTVRLLTDAATFSGFQWSSGTGPQVAVGSGTPCQGEVVLEEVPPVSYVIPFFKKVLLGETDATGITRSR